jgi:DNA replication and repair protein RecF
VYYSWHHEYPIFLLDDVDAELDGKRIGQLLEYLEGRTQTFVTTSKEQLVQQYAARAAVFEVRGGIAVRFGVSDDQTSPILDGSSGI